ncbi:MAG: hypothetical protein V4508_08945 [Pseudomonadota bacterium]
MDVKPGTIDTLALERILDGDLLALPHKKHERYFIQIVSVLSLIVACGFAVFGAATGNLVLVLVDAVAALACGGARDRHLRHVFRGGQPGQARPLLVPGLCRRRRLPAL